MTEKISLTSICKACIAVFILYVCWFKYAFREMTVIIYLTGFVSVVCMMIDLIQKESKVEQIFPFGVTVNVILCAYSVIIGVIIAVNVDVLVSEIKTYLCFALICMVICYVTYIEKKIDWLANILAFTAILCCIQVTVKGYYIELYGYVMSADNNPHALGMTLDMGIFGIAFTNRKRSAARTLLCYFFIVAFIYFIIGCGSRKCLIAAIIITLIWVLPQIKERLSNGSVYTRVFTLIIVTVVIALGAYYYRNIYIHSNSYDRMQLLGDTTIVNGSSTRREYYYQRAFELFLENPLFGIGYRQFQYNNMYHAISHSTYAEAIASWGLVGCLLYFLPVIVSGMKLIKTAISTKGTYEVRVVLALWVMEIFLGVGQIWFYTVEHMIAWTVIFIIVKRQQEETLLPGRKCKYVKD